MVFLLIVFRRHTLTLVPSKGRVYSFGLGGVGQLGTKASVNSNTPQLVLGPWLSPSGTSVIETNKLYIVKSIYAGGDQCFVKVTHKMVFIILFKRLVSIIL